MFHTCILFFMGLQVLGWLNIVRQYWKDYQCLILSSLTASTLFRPVLRFPMSFSNSVILERQWKKERDGWEEVMMKGIDSNMTEKGTSFLWHFGTFSCLTAVRCSDSEVLGSFVVTVFATTVPVQRPKLKPVRTNFIWQLVPQPEILQSNPVHAGNS